LLKCNIIQIFLYDFSLSLSFLCGGILPNVSELQKSAGIKPDTSSLMPLSSGGSYRTYACGFGSECRNYPNFYKPVRSLQLVVKRRNHHPINSQGGRHFFLFGFFFKSNKAYKSFNVALSKTLRNTHFPS